VILMLGEVFLSFLAVVGMLIVGGIVASIWMTFVVIRKVFGAVFRGAFGSIGQPNRMSLGGLPRVCSRALCRAENPAGARYCRRCGKDLGAAYAQGARHVDSEVVGGSNV
jgi:hypothetical protein